MNRAAAHPSRRQDLAGRHRHQSQWPTALIAAALGIILHLAVMAAGGIVPFGGLTRAQSDYRAQCLPFHRAWGQALRGSALIDLRFNWLVGLGVGTLPDYATYFSSPLALLMGLLPPSRAELGLTLVVLLKLGAAAGAMALLIQRAVGHEHRWLAVALGIAYSHCSCVYDLGVCTPMWLDGLLGFPLLCLAAQRVAAGRGWFRAVVVIAFVWWSNYYTAWMASLGAAVWLAIHVVEEQGTRGLPRALTRFAGAGLLGTALTAPILLPTLEAIRCGTPVVGPGTPTAS